MSDTTEVQEAAQPPVREQAERYADSLIDRYSPAEDSLEGIRLIIGIAYLEGQTIGSAETVRLMQAELERAVIR